MSERMKALIFEAMLRREARKVDVECSRWKGRRFVRLPEQLIENRFAARKGGAA